MPGKILGIDINEDFISAVQVVRGMKGFQVLSCHSVPVDKDNGPAVALKELSEKTDLKGDFCIVSVDGRYISYHNLVMPFKDPKKIKQTLPFELEGLVPFPVDNLVIDFNIVKSSDQTDILAVSAQKSLISDCLETLKPFGISPDLIDIRPVSLTLWLLAQSETPDNGVVIDIGKNRVAVLMFIDRRIALIRNLSLTNGVFTLPSVEKTNAPSREGIEAISESINLHLKNTLRSSSSHMKRRIVPEQAFITGIWSQYQGAADILGARIGIPVKRIDMRNDNGIRMDLSVNGRWEPGLMDGALSLAVREIKKGHGFNLRKDEFEVKKNLFKSVKELRHAGIAVMVILLLLMIDLGADYYVIKNRYEAAEQQCADVFRQLFPDAGEVKYPLLQMKQKMEELKKSAVMLPGNMNKGQKVLDIIKDISQRIPSTFDMDVSNMTIDSDTVRISGETDSYDTVNNIESALESSPYFSDPTIKAEHSRTGEKVEFELKLQRK